MGKLLKAYAGKMMLPGKGFYVEGMKGPLRHEEEVRAENWARNILTKG